MFYRRKSYTVKADFVDNFNQHFNTNLLPNQQKYGSRLIGRWMKDNKDGTFEIFAIWEYDSYERYVEIDSNIRNDKDNAKRVKDWYEGNGGRDYVYKEYILAVKNEEITSTVENVFPQPENQD